MAETNLEIKLSINKKQLIKDVEKIIKGYKALLKELKRK